MNELSIKKCVKELIGCSQAPEAAFCASDLIAITAMNYLQDEHYSIPDDFSICGIDDIDLSRYHYPALTTIQIDKNAMGELAVNMLDKLINEEKTETNVVVPSDKLIIRSSVKNLKK